MKYHKVVSEEVFRKGDLLLGFYRIVIVTRCGYLEMLNPGYTKEIRMIQTLNLQHDRMYKGKTKVSRKYLPVKEE